MRMAYCYRDDCPYRVKLRNEGKQAPPFGLFMFKKAPKCPHCKRRMTATCNIDINGDFC